MKESTRGSLIAGIGLIVLGSLLIVFNMIPNISVRETWPLVFLIAAIGFYIPALVWHESKRGLAALFIPGTILFGLGAIFLFNTLTHIWWIWAFAWILIPASVGLGLMLAAWAGKWNRIAWLVGLWLAILSLAIFALFAALFGGTVVKFIGAGLLLAMGLYLVIRSIIAKPTVK